MARTIFKRANFYDGQNIVEETLDTEQSAWVGTTANVVDLTSGSGIENEYITQRILFDTSDVPATITTLITTQNFDGEPIYPTDSFDSTVFLQPSDSTQGNQLAIEISGSSLDGTPSLKVYIFGQIFDGDFKEEVFTFNSNGEQVTRNYYTNVVAIMTQDFRGNQNTLIDGVASRNNGGRLRIFEALPLRLARDSIMASQSREPNQDYVNFKPATLFETLDTLLDEIAATESLNKADLDINVTSTTTRNLPANTTGVIVGEKFQATTNNIQKVTVLLSVVERTLVTAGEEFDWSGDIVVGIRKLQTTNVCPTATIPENLIEFDPEPSSLAEISFAQTGLEDIGVILSDTAQEVDFIFTQSLLSNPNIEPTIVPGDYYVVTVRRSGDVSTGTIVLEEAANTDAAATDIDNMRMTVFAQNTWTDVSNSDMWFKIHTDAVRVVDGTAYEDGRQLTSPKVQQNSTTGLEEPYVEGDHSFIDVSEDVKNYMIIQAATEFSDVESHPTTGNAVFSKINDTPSFSVINESTLMTLISGGNKPIILGSAYDNNPVGNPEITGTTLYPGLMRATTFTLINPPSDVLVYNLVGSVITPNSLEPNLKYRIIKQDLYTDAYGDINKDGDIDISDVTRAQELGDIVSGEGYAKNLVDGSVPSATQLAAIVAGTVTMEEIIRADVTGNELVTITDVSYIQQYISLGTAFPAGSSFTRVVLTVESLTDPLTTSVDMLTADADFNTVPFTFLTYTIEFIPRWDESEIIIGDLRRFIPKTFTSIATMDITGTTQNGGTNTVFLPGDVLVEGDVFDSDGDPHPLDFEVNNIVLELPDGYIVGEIDIFSNFIKGAMSFSDGTLVGTTALTNNQVRVATSIQSFCKDLDGFDYESVDGYAEIDEVIGILYTQSSGLLRIRASNLRFIDTRPELRTKIILTVSLKKAGFINSDRTVTKTEVEDLLVSIPV